MCIISRHALINDEKLVNILTPDVLGIRLHTKAREQLPRGKGELNPNKVDQVILYLHSFKQSELNEYE